MRILVADKLSAAAIELLDRSKVDYDYLYDISKEELASKISDYDALIVRSRTKVTKEILEEARSLKVIGRAGVGLDNIDAASAKSKGIMVVNTPDALTEAVAEFTLGLMISLSRKISQADSSVRGGKWEKSNFVGSELKGKTYGAIGLGRIGRRVAELAHAFGMTILANDIVQIPEDVLKTLGITMCSREKVLSSSDFVDLHLPLTSETQYLMDYRALGKMKHTAFLINTSRGKIVNESDLLRALDEGLIAGAALDVFENEPELDPKISQNEKILLTPHIAGQTEEAQIEAGVTVVREVLRYLQSS